MVARVLIPALRLSSWLAPGALLFACGTEPVDAGAWGDAAVAAADAGLDSALVDAAAPDARGSADAVPADAGPIPDAGPAPDASSVPDAVPAVDAAADVRVPPDPIAAEWPAACDLVEQWRVDTRPIWNDPAVFGYSANDGLLWATHHGQWPAAVVRARDGALLTGETNEQIIAVDPSWRHYAGRDAEGNVFVADFLGDAVRARFPNERGRGDAGAATFSPDGALAASVGCELQSDGTGVIRVTVQALREAEGRLVFERTIEDMACISYSDRPILEFTDDNELIVVTPDSTDAWIVSVDGALRGPFDLVLDLDTGTDPSEEWSSLVPNIIELHAVSGGRRVVTSATDGIARVWELPDLRPVRDLGPVTVGVLNQMTYAPPIQVAPLAVSDDGQLVAFASGPREVTVANIEGEALAVFPVEILADEWGASGEYDVLGRLAFSHDARSLAVLHSGGVASFGCVGAGPAPTGRATVRLDGATSTVVGAEVEFVATHAGTSNVHVHEFVLDGEVVQAGVLARSWLWTPTEPGEFEVRVRVDDGADEAEASLRVQVLP